VQSTRAKKWDFLEDNHPTYYRRLAKEINLRAFSGVYYREDGDSYRVVQAKVKQGDRGKELWLKTMEDSWLLCRDVNRLDDGAGNKVCAAKTVCGM
jgi:hypothetical protein